MAKRFPHIRLVVCVAVLLLVSALLVYRLFSLSVIKHARYARTAQAQNESITNVLARGNIYLTDSDGKQFLAATNKKFAVAYIVPADIARDARTLVAEKLAQILELPTDDIAAKIEGGSRNMKVLARRISNDDVGAIKALGVKGVGVSYEQDRYYPAGKLGAHALGFLGYDSEGRRAGQYGVEGFYNDQLFGQSPDTRSLFESVKVFDMLHAAFAKIMRRPAPENPVSREPDIPSDAVLTIDRTVQEFVEARADDLMRLWTPSGATIIVQHPTTGKIIAMATRPTFDPNTYQTSEPRLFLNSAVQEIFEPGSSFKPMTMAMGLDLAKVTPQTTYTDPGIVNIAGYDIGNYDRQAHGVKTMTEVLEKSLNTGTMFVQDLVGNDAFLNYAINMGFGQSTGVDMPGEVAGDITNLYSGRKINFMTASFGQGIAVTPLQLVNAYSMIANGGKLMRPYVVEKIIKENGQEVVTQPEVITIPISEKTSQKVQTMLTSVVDRGFDKARISGYDVAGKTGTAQIADGKGGYLEGQFIHNFLGFAPSYDAQFVILIKMEKPQGITYAADSLSPTFKEIAQYLLTYYKIPPTRK